MDFARRGGGGGGGGGKLRREGYDYCEVDDEQDDPATRHALNRPFNIASSSSSAAAAAAAESSSSSPSPSPSPSSQIQKEHMFDKVVTPSDVGKLNRLVIPKQHAEKYFPLDTTTHEKGLLLSFEDRRGKPWRFRYSYWNSSQSYVMTKGWSRFVKEKRLDAGDTVSFGRGVDDKDRLFIDWKRRPEIHDPSRGHHLPRIPLPLPPSNYHHGHHHHHPMVSFARSVGPWAGRILVPPAATVYDGHHRQNYVYDAVAGGGPPGEYHIFRSAVSQQPQAAVQLGISGFGSGCGGDQDGTVLGAAAAAPMVPESVPLVQTQAATGKRMRLFGVNLDLPDSDGDPGESSIRSQASGTFSSSSSPSPRGKEKQEPSLDLDM